MKAAVLQPTYLPWMGYFEMIDSSDVYVVLDHVQFERQSWQQRNKIKTANGVIFLTVPVPKKMPLQTPIFKVEISKSNKDYLLKHWKAIELAYKKAKYFNVYGPLLKEIYLKNHNLLKDLNFDIIKTVMEILGIKKKVIFSSDLNLNDENLSAMEKLINLCKKENITHFHEPKGGEVFFDKLLFEKNGIELTFQNFEHPKYTQLWGEFVPYLSVIDLIFNEGEKSLSIIKSGRR